MSDLAALIERVERLTKADRETDIQIAVALIDAKREKNWYHWQASRPRGSVEGTPEEYWRSRHDRCPPFTAFIDAAVALTERVLPGWAWSTMRKDFAVARVSRALGDAVEGFDAIHDKPAIALILATLRALQAQEEGS